MIAEAAHNANIYRGVQNQHVRKTDLLRIPRPGDRQKTQKKLGGAPVPLGELVVFLGEGWDDYFSGAS